MKKKRTNTKKTTAKTVEPNKETAAAPVNCCNPKTIWAAVLMAVGIWSLVNGYLMQSIGSKWWPFLWYMIGLLLIFSGKMYFKRGYC